MISKEQLEELYVKQRLGTPAIGKILGVNRGTVYFALDFYGMIDHTKTKAQKISEKKYKGAKTKAISGYTLISIQQPDGSYDQVYEHRYIMEQKLGRKLLSNEEVHHKDKNKTNNDPDNLQLETKHTHGNQHQHYSTEYMFQWIRNFEDTHSRRPKAREFTDFTYQAFRERFNYKAKDAWKAYEQSQ